MVVPMAKSGSSIEVDTADGRTLSADAIRAQMEKVLTSSELRQSRRMQDFLRFIVSETLAGREDRLKEFSIAVEVFGRESSFDPKTSSIVRVEASRLRRRLREYSLAAGKGDQIHIGLPPGTYTPTFTLIESIGDDAAPPQAADSAEVEPRSASLDKPAIAVLPFANVSGDAEQEVFADGLAEDLITALSRIRWLFVIARNSTFTYKGGVVDVKQVSRQMGVRYVLEGSVRRSRDRVRVSAQLVDATTGIHIWAETFDRKLIELFELQDEITQRIAGTLEPELEHYERERALRKPPESLDAWESYQRGLWHMFRANAEDNLAAQRLFRLATESDPRFSLAYAGLAYSHTMDVPYGYGKSSENSLALAIAAAERAVALDDREAWRIVRLGEPASTLETWQREFGIWRQPLP